MTARVEAVLAVFSCENVLRSTAVFFRPSCCHPGIALIQTYETLIYCFLCEKHKKVIIIIFYYHIEILKYNI